MQFRPYFLEVLRAKMPHMRVVGIAWEPRRVSTGLSRATVATPFKLF